MKFTSEDLLKILNLQVGDRIHLFHDEAKEFDEGVYQIIKEQPDDYPRYYVFENINDSDDRYNIKSLIDLDFEILLRPKRVGELKCDDYECSDCPLQYVCCLSDWGFATNDNLFNILELFNCDDQEIHDLLKARLDKELKEYENI